MRVLSTKLSSGRAANVLNCGSISLALPWDFITGTQVGHIQYPEGSWKTPLILEIANMAIISFFLLQDLLVSRKRARPSLPFVPSEEGAIKYPINTQIEF